MSLPKKGSMGKCKGFNCRRFYEGWGNSSWHGDLVAEFKAKVVGVAVLVATAKPEKKLVKDYTPLLTLESVDLDKKTIDIYPQDRAFS